MIGIFAVVFAMQATAAMAGAARYPSGLDPALCPNYPHCNNALLAAHAHPGGPAAVGDYYNGADGSDDGQYGSAYQHHHPSGDESGQYRHHQHHQNKPAPYTEPGYPAGLSSSNCPNYPYCSHQVPAEALRYSGPAAKRYPAGVGAHNCPNYPYCY